MGNVYWPIKQIQQLKKHENSCYFYNMISNPMVAPKNWKCEELHKIIYPMVSIVILETTCLGMFHVWWLPFPFHCWLQRTILDLKFPSPSLYVLIYTVWISIWLVLPFKTFLSKQWNHLDMHLLSNHLN